MTFYSLPSQRVKPIFESKRVVQHTLTSNDCRKKGWPTWPDLKQALSMEPNLGTCSSVFGTGGAHLPRPEALERLFPVGCSRATLHPAVHLSSPWSEANKKTGQLLASQDRAFIQRMELRISQPKKSLSLSRCRKVSLCNLLSPSFV